jgi:cysteine desulfurase
MTERIAYLDNAATTPVRPEVLEAMMSFLTPEAFGNPSSSHRFGRAARAELETSRRTIARALGAEPSEVVFTSGGTEADNLAVLGAALASRGRGGPFRVAVSALEHKAVIEAAEAVEHLGGEAVVLPVDAVGRVDRPALHAALERGVAVVSVMWVNNETGVMPNIAAVAAWCAEADTPFHTDAVQAIGRVPCTMDAVPISLLTISGHKIGAPKGIGALVVRGHDIVAPLIHGGGQQRGIRPGTENVAGAIGLGVAVALAVAELDETTAKTGRMRNDLERRLRGLITDLAVHGATADRAPHISSVAIPGTNAESLMMHLDLAGIACSSGAACSTGTVSVSHVLTALGVPMEHAMGTLRFSFRKDSTNDEVDRVINELPATVERVRKLTATLGR